MNVRDWATTIMDNPIIKIHRDADGNIQSLEVVGDKPNSWKPKHDWANEGF